jgi:PAS domain S-box-containing protein
LIVDANLKAIELIGYEKELLTMHQSQLLPPEFAEIAKLKFEEFTSSNEYNSIEALVQTKNGKKVPVQITSSGSFQIGEEVFSAAYFQRYY